MTGGVAWTGQETPKRRLKKHAAMSLDKVIAGFKMQMRLIRNNNLRVAPKENEAFRCFQWATGMNPKA
jgi:hypothetical protein